MDGSVCFDGQPVTLNIFICTQSPGYNRVPKSITKTGVLGYFFRSNYL
jgi:hypothetical protein